MRIITMTGLCLVLAACGDNGGDGTGGATAEKDGGVLDQIADARTKPKVGRWESTAELVDIEAPGVPESQKRMVMQMMGGKQTHNYCVTPEDAEKDMGELVRNTQEMDCDYSESKSITGKIEAKAVCQQDGMTLSMTMTGSYTPTSYTYRNVFEGGTDAQIGKMVWEGEGRHVGDCDGTEED